MTIFQAIISGIVQGVTEFFPVSSSGHLVILHSLFGIDEPMVAFDIFLHFGTLVSVLIFFRKDISDMLNKDRAMLKFIIIGSVPTFAIAMLIKDAAEKFFAMPSIVGSFLVLTGLFMMLSSLSASYWKIVNRFRRLRVPNSIAIGIAQGIAVLPGISRSGATIGTALIAGLNEETALKYSFLLSVPAVLGANLLKAKEICGNLVSIDTVTFIAGALAAMLTGILAIKVMYTVLKKNLFFLFGIYCILMGAAVMALSGK